MSQKTQNKKSYSHRHRHEIKRNKVIESKRSKVENNVNNVTKAVLEEPRLCSRPEFINVRNFVEIVPNNLSKFPIKSNASTIAHKESN